MTTASRYYIYKLLVTFLMLPVLAFAETNTTESPSSAPSNTQAPPTTAPQPLLQLSASPTRNAGTSTPTPASPPPAVSTLPPVALPSAPVASNSAPVVLPPPANIVTPPAAAPASPPASQPGTSANTTAAPPVIKASASPMPTTPTEEMLSIPDSKKISVDNLMLTPLHAGDTSLMFTAEEMKLIAPFFVLYDGNKDISQQDKKDTSDDLSSLLDTIKSQTKTAQPELPKALPNLYLGSILYYSPTQWSVWINDKKLLNSRNAPENSLYISRISRNEIELVWKPATLLDVPTTWNQLTSDGKNPLKDIFVDKDKGTITVHLHPNQTFISSRLLIHEGFVKSPIISSPPQK